MAVIRTLSSFDSMPFHGLTYPSLQSLLWRAGHGEVTAVGATEGDEAVGLAMSMRLPHKGFTRVASLFVAEPHRRRGIGTQLLAGLEQQLRREGVKRMEITYQTGRSTSEAPPRILARLGWPAPQPDRLICRCDRRMLTSDWLQREYPVPAGARIVAWSEVTAGQVEALKASQAGDPWIPATLRPWEYANPAFNSVAMLQHDAVVGWVLTQVYNSTTLIYSNSYMHPRLQRRARILPLYVAAVRHHGQVEACCNAIWVVPFVHESMVKFVRTYMARDMNRVEELRVSMKEIDAVAEDHAA